MYGVAWNRCIAIYGYKFFFSWYSDHKGFNIHLFLYVDAHSILT